MKRDGGHMAIFPDDLELGMKVLQLHGVEEDQQLDRQARTLRNLWRERDLPFLVLWVLDPKSAPLLRKISDQDPNFIGEVSLDVLDNHLMRADHEWQGVLARLNLGQVL